MKTNLKSACSALGIGLMMVNSSIAAEADQPAQDATTPAVHDMSAPYALTVAETFEMQGDGIPWAHEINVVLPASYHLKPEKKYPVLWVTDGAYYLNLLPSMVSFMHSYRHLPEMIIATVGYPADTPLGEFVTRRRKDFFIEDGGPWRRGDKSDPAAAFYASIARQPVSDPADIYKDAHADKFLDFLVDDVRPALASKYRVDGDHALIGHSAGGAFAAWSIFQRPGAFKRYLIGSGTGQFTLEMEKEYAKKHKDLDARIFIGAGDIEASGIFGASQRLATNPMRLGENLVLRQYPSLEVEIAVFRGKDHATVIPVSFSEGLAFLYEDFEQ